MPPQKHDIRGEDGSVRPFAAGATAKFETARLHSWNVGARLTNPSGDSIRDLAK
jgi:hypothetical protein